MSFTVVIPARKASTRLPNKPLLDLDGQSLVQRVYVQATKSKANRVVIATDSKEILEHSQKFGAEAILTNTDHNSGTDRVHEASLLLEIPDNEIIVNVQGDEPFIDPEDINQTAFLLKEKNNFDISTLYSPIESDQIDNPNVVKIWMNNQEVLLFSRDPHELNETSNRYRHLGIYAYSLSTLSLFVSWEMSEGEKTQKLEQLRGLENGLKFGAKISVSKVHLGIDTPSDIDKALEIIKNGN